MEGRSLSMERNSPGSARLDAIEGLSQQWALALERTGVSTIGDVLAADPDTLAYMLDGYENAEQVVKLVRAHAKYLEARLESRNERAGSGATAPPASSPQTGTQSRTSTPASSPKTCSDPRAGTPSDAHTDLHFGAVLGALALASVQEQKHQWLCRLDAMRALIDHGGSEAQVAALLALDPCTPASEEIRGHVEREGGAYMKQLLEQCERVLAVAIGPDGSVASGHARRVAQASTDARRVCTVLALARTGALGSYAETPAVDHERASIRQMYYRALADSLHETEPCPLTKRLLQHVREGKPGSRAA